MKSISRKVAIALAVITPITLAQPLLAATHMAPGSAASADSSGMAMMPMQRQMQSMQEDMTKLHGIKDPDERQALMRKHTASMQGMMQMMHGMMAGQEMMHGQPGEMMNKPMRAPGAQGSPKMEPGAMAGRMGMMEQRMNMMQMMMDQMLQQQGLLLDENGSDKR